MISDLEYLWAAIVRSGVWVVFEPNCLLVLAKAISCRPTARSRLLSLAILIHVGAFVHDISLILS